MAQKLVKSGDKTFVASSRGGLNATVPNRVLSDEANFALAMIEKWALVSSDGGVALNGQLMKPGAVVERAFEIARLTFEHIKANRMDAPFPFKKVYGDGENG